jgi:hypothetical protein
VVGSRSGADAGATEHVGIGAPLSDECPRTVGARPADLNAETVPGRLIPSFVAYGPDVALGRAGPTVAHGWSELGSAPLAAGRHGGTVVSGPVSPPW